jgi:hypothetical protein
MIAPTLYKFNYDPNTGRGRGAEAEMLTVNARFRPIRSRKPAIPCGLASSRARSSAAQT